MSWIEKIKCDQCAVETHNTTAWISIWAGTNLLNYRKVNNVTAQTTRLDFCSKECLMKYFVGEKNEG